MVKKTQNRREHREDTENTEKKLCALCGKEFKTSCKQRKPLRPLWLKNTNLQKPASYKIPLPRFIIIDSHKPMTQKMTAAELSEYLSKLPHWRLETIAAPHGEGQEGSELLRKFKFASFLEAMRFMAEAAVYIDKTNHHPKWENEWVHVVVRLTTWDMGRRVSALDIDLAYYLEDLYQKTYKP